MGDEGTDQTTAAGSKHHADRDELIEIGGFALEEAADNLEDDDYKAENAGSAGPAIPLSDNPALGMETVQTVRDDDDGYNPLTDPPKQSGATSATSLKVLADDEPETESGPDSGTDDDDPGDDTEAEDSEPEDPGEKITVSIGTKKPAAPPAAKPPVMDMVAPKKPAAAAATAAPPPQAAPAQDEPVFEELDEAGSVAVRHEPARAAKAPAKPPTAPAPAPKTVRPAVAAAPNPKKRRSMRIFAVVFCLLLAAAGAGAYWWYQQPKLKHFDVTSSGVKYGINYFPGAKKVTGEGDKAPGGLLFTEDKKGIVAALAPDTNETCKKDKSSKVFDITVKATGRSAPVYAGKIVDKTYIYVMCLTDQHGKLHLISIMAANSQDDISPRLKAIKASLASVSVE